MADKKILVSRKIKRYGWKRDLPDLRDHKLETIRQANLPKTCDLRPGMPPVYDQLDLGSCHDDQTEVLTKSGWKHFGAATLEDEFASVDPDNGELIYERPVRLVRHHHDGDIYRARHGSLDFAVTPDHTMIVRKWDESERTLSDHYSRVEMKDVGWYAGFLTKVKYAGTRAQRDTITLAAAPGRYCLKKQREPLTLSMSTWLKFLGIFVAEGTLLRERRPYQYALKREVESISEVGGDTAVSTRPTHTVQYKIQLAAVKEREKEFIRAVLADLGVQACELSDRFTFSDKRIWKALEDLGYSGVRAPAKFAPKFVFDLSASQIDDFLQGHLMGDGYIADDTVCHYTSSKRLADDLQLLTFLSGRWSQISDREPRISTMADGRKVSGRHPEYRVSRWSSGSLSLDKKRDVTIEHYSGDVFCAEVPTNHTLVTRRNGKMLISGNCTANATAGLAQFLMMKNWRTPSANFTPSRLFIYYNERVLEGTVDQDSGASLRDGMKVINQVGAPHETFWSYNEKKFAVKPTGNVYADARIHKFSAYMSVGQNHDAICSVLASGYPVVFGFSAYDALESDTVAKSGVLPMPSASDKPIGGHACLIVGYDDNARVFIIRNSWSAAWGIGGYFSMPYDYVLNNDLADDFWSSQSIS